MFRANCVRGFFCIVAMACASVPRDPVVVPIVQRAKPPVPAEPYVAYCAEAERPPELCCMRESRPPRCTVAALWESGVLVANVPGRYDDLELRAYRISPAAAAELIALVRERVWTRAWESRHYPHEESVTIRLSTASTLESGSVTAHYVDSSMSINQESPGWNELLPALEAMRASATPLDTPVLFHTLPWDRYAPYGR